MGISYRNYLIATHDDGRFVALDPSDPSCFKMFSADLRRIYSAIDGLWLALAGATTTPWARMLDHDEVDLDAVVGAA